MKTKRRLFVNEFKLGLILLAVATFLFIPLGAFAYDRFDSEFIDLTKWEESDHSVREISDGKLRMNEYGTTRRFSTYLHLNTPVTGYLESKITVQSGSLVLGNGTGYARIGAYFYNSDLDTGSYNGYEGNVWSGVRIELENDNTLTAKAYLWKSTAFDQSAGETLLDQEFAKSINFDTEYTLSMELSGSQLIFRCGDEEIIYQIQTPVYTPYDPYQHLCTRIYPEEGSAVSVKALFDDVSLTCTGGSGDELALDFGPAGLWDYDGTTWTHLAAWDPDDGMVEWTGGLAVDFGVTHGLWNYDGTTWTHLAAWDPENDANYGIAWNNDLAVDFGTNGLWSYDGTTWTNLAAWNPDGISEWTGGLAVNFGATNGLWNYDGTTWTHLAAWESEYEIAWNNDLAVDFDTNGLWSYDGTTWTNLASWNPDLMVEWTGGLAVDFDTYGLWNYDGTTWTQLAAWNPENEMVNWSDGIAVDFGPNGLWSYDGSSWTSLATWNPEEIEAWTNGLAVDFGAVYGLWNYSGSAWSNLAGWDSEDMIDIDLY